MRSERKVTSVAKPAARVLVAGRSAAVDRDAWTQFEARGIDVVTCATSHALLEEVLQHAPAVLVFALRADPGEDLGVMHLVRRVVADLPIVLLAAEESLDTRKVVQQLRPVYYGVCPIETAELRDAVSAALQRLHLTT